MYYWIKNCKRRVAKKYVKKLSTDVSLYSYEEWNVLLEVVRRLKVGGIIFNNYLYDWGVISKVDIFYSPLPYKGRMVGQIIDVFVITIDFAEASNFFEYDPFSVYYFLEKCKDEDVRALIIPKLKEFNKSIGLPEDQVTKPKSIKELK